MNKYYSEFIEFLKITWDFTKWIILFLLGFYFLIIGVLLFANAICKHC